MSVASYGFLLAFLPAVLIGFRRLGGNAGQVFLVLAGLLFCGWGAPWSLAVLLAEGAVTYALGAAMGRPGRNKKLLLWAGCAVVLVVLAVFKYTPAAQGLAALAPLGLSFFSFQQLFWLHDRYTGQVQAVSPLSYAACMTYFPLATSGPITRVGELAPQLSAPAPFSWEDMASGLWCFSLGLFKKVLLAGLFAGGADWGFSLAGTLAPADALLVSLCYTLQIYFDFSGYCDMAWGIGRMMGVELPVNFNSPYRAFSIAGFWKRWHTTLSRFFTHCVYIPLGGSRRGMAVTCRNIMIVFLLSGLWHGAGLGFLVWGALHGGAMVLERLCRGKLRLPKPLGWLLTFLFVNAAWVFFRAEHVSQALALLGDMGRGGWTLPSPDFADALLLPEFRALASFVKLIGGGNSALLSYWLPLLALPLGMALLALPNPPQQARSFRPGVWKALAAAAALVWSVISLSGVETFIYANF